MNYKNEQFDAIALVFAHFNAEIRIEYHDLLNSYLRKGGILIIEAFSKSHLEYRIKNSSVGGPRDLETLCSAEEFESYFNNFEIIELVEQEIELNEGLLHVGKGAAVRFVGVKNNCIEVLF